MVVVFVLNHLRSHILQSATESVSLLHMVRLHAPPKITNFDDISILNQDIFWLDISVNQALLMHIVDATADLYEKIKGSVFAKKLFFPNQIK